MIFRLCHVTKAGGKDIITHQHSHLIIIRGIHRRLSSAFAAFIDHIIMNQRSCMQQFECDSCVLSDVRHLTVILGRE